MSVDRLEVRVSITKLLLALMLVIVPLSILGLVLTQRSDKTLDNAVGSNFKAMAQLYAGQVTQFVHERVIDTGVLASNPTIVSAAATSAKSKGALDQSASQLLRQQKSMDPRYLSLVVTDASGNVVASSQPMSVASYAQDALWQSVYNNGQGSARNSDILDDSMAKANYVKIGLPIADASGQAIGVLSAAVNINEVLTPFRQEQIGSGARANLVNENGLIVSGPNADVFAHVKAPEYDFVRDALGTNQGSATGWVTADLAPGPYIVGYAGTGLKQHFPNLGWVVTVSQDEHAAAAPVRLLERFAIGMVVLALFMLTLLCVYYYLHRAQKFSYMDDEIAAEQPRAAAASI